MTSEPPPRDALRPYRPLPSIDVPLLREERSAVRNRRLARGILAAATLVGLGSAAFGLSLLDRGGEAPRAEDGSDALAAERERETALSASAEHRSASDAGVGTHSAALEPAAIDFVAAPRDPAPAKPAGAGASAVSTRTTPFGRAISFKDALVQSAGLTQDEANELITALTGTLDFRRSQPTDTLTVERDSEGKLVRFEYRSGLTQRYEAVRGEADRLSAKQIEVPINAVRLERGGIIDGSLGDALEGLNLGRTLAGVFTEVFEGKVSFSTDTRTGDTFKIIVDEEYVDGTFLRYGTVHALEFQGEKAGTHRAFWHETKNGDGDFYDPTGRAMHGGWLRTPLRYDHISSDFGMRFHPVLKRKQLHNGIDYAASSGTPVRAAADGEVTFARAKGANGNLVALAHANGYETFYAHLLRFAPGIKRGVKVSQRQLIGYVGSTGRSTGPHLHFSLKRRGRFINPAEQLNGPGLPMPQAALPAYKRSVRRLSADLDKIRPERPRPVADTSDAVLPLDMNDGEL